MTRRGLSIVEVIVTIAVIGVVVAVLVPVLGSSRATARERRAVADVRTLAAVVTAYAADSDGFVPAFGSPADDPPASAGQPVPLESAFYFDLHRVWHHKAAALDDGLTVESELFHPSPPGLGVDQGAPFYTAQNLSCAFVAQPGFWNAKTRRLGPSQLRPQRLSAVAFPSAKSLIVTTRPYVGLPPDPQRATKIPASFADGSAEAIAPRDRLPGYDRGDGPTHQQYGPQHFSDFPPMLHTLEGVRGRDRR